MNLIADLQGGGGGGGQAPVPGAAAAGDPHPVALLPPGAAGAASSARGRSALGGQGCDARVGGCRVRCACCPGHGSCICCCHCCCGPAGAASRQVRAERCAAWDTCAYTSCKHCGKGCNRSAHCQNRAHDPACTHGHCSTAAHSICSSNSSSQHLSLCGGRRAETAWWHATTPRHPHHPRPPLHPPGPASLPRPFHQHLHAI